VGLTFDCGCIVNLFGSFSEMASQQEVPKTVSETQSEKQLKMRSYWCRTKGELYEVDFEWTIERLAFFYEVGVWEPLTSTDFGGIKHKFHLSIGVHNNLNIGIKLFCSTLFFTFPTRAAIVISNEKCEKIFQNMIGISPNTRFPVDVFEISKKTFLESGNFVSGEMTVYCKVSRCKREHSGMALATEKYLLRTPISDNSQNLILDQLEEMFEKMPLSDVTFKIRGRKFAAHKAILAMRSPVLAAMFRHPTKEMQSNQVEVKDVDPDVLHEILRFIYTGKTQSTAMDKLAPRLLAAADKYLLEDLKIQCETHLIRQMSAENCLELLSLTTHHPAEHLKKYAIEYFRRYPGKSSLNGLH
jgi:speckle-type POZ protein